MKAFFDFFGPLKGAIKGQVTWQEVAASALLGVVFLLLGGKISDLFIFITNNAELTSGIVSAITAFITSLLFRKQQGNDGWVPPDQIIKDK